MASRCGLPNTNGNHASMCCRLTGHAGDCHRHISSRMTKHPHATMLRATGKLIHCSEGAALDE